MPRSQTRLHISFISFQNPNFWDCCIYLPSKLSCDLSNTPFSPLLCDKGKMCQNEALLVSENTWKTLSLFAANCIHCSDLHKTKRDQPFGCKACLFLFLQYCSGRDGELDMVVEICKSIHKAHCFAIKGNGDCVKAPWEIGAGTAKALPIISWTDV